MDEKERLLRNEIREMIDPNNIIDYGIQETMINNLFKRFYIIPKENVVTSIGINGKTILEVEPWDLEPIPEQEMTPEDMKEKEFNPVVINGVLVVSECCGSIKGIRNILDNGVEKYYCNQCGKEVHTIIFPQEEE